MAADCSGWQPECQCHWQGLVQVVVIEVGSRKHAALAHSVTHTHTLNSLSPSIELRACDTDLHSRRGEAAGGVAAAGGEAVEGALAVAA